LFCGGADIENWSRLARLGCLLAVSWLGCAAMRARRHLVLDGARNVRDVGGYWTEDGRRTRWRTLLRADSLHRLTGAAQSELVDYGVRSVVDLRRPAEAAAAPSAFGGVQSVRYVQLPMGSEPLLTAVDPVPRSLFETYRLGLEQRAEPIRQVLAFLTEPGTLPAVVHCTAGRDRTGLVIALALAVAGVPPRTIAHDYALSRRYLGDEPEHCSSAVMLQTLAWIDNQHGGANAYLRRAGLRPDQLGALREALTT
jgi:protein-tyrosine phosphatase